MDFNSNISRRSFIRAFGSAAAAGFLVSCSEEEIKKPDVVLINGLVYNKGSFRKLDVAISKGEIINVGEYAGSEAPSSAEIIDCEGMYVSPGWADLHVHAGGIGVDIARLGAPMGVTALLDAGTYGPENFEVFKNEIYGVSDTPIYALLNLRKDGLQINNISKPNTPADVDPEGAEALIKKYPDIIRGLKVRTDLANIFAEDPLYLARVTAELGASLKLPVSYHLGAPAPSIEDFLKLAREGDIITHFLRNPDNAILDESGSARPQALEAMQGGVCFDVGHGVASFLWDTAFGAFDLGIDNFTISSDMWSLPLSQRAISFSNVMSKFLLLGFSLQEVIEKAAVMPRRKLGLPSKIEKGARTDITVFKVHDVKSDFDDSAGIIRTGDKRIVPEYAVIKSRVSRAGDFDREYFEVNG